MSVINQEQPPVLPVSVVKIEPSDSEIIENGIDDILDSPNKEVITEIKDVDTASHILCEDSIKSEILHTYTQVFVKTENIPFVKIENITKSENVSEIEDRNVNRSTYQDVVEVKGTNKPFNSLINLEIDQQLFIDSKGIIIKAEHLKKTNFANCYKTVKSTSCEKDKKKIKVIEAPVIPVESDEYTTIAEDRHVCNHCQYVFHTLQYVRRHIRKMHRDVMRMYQCPYCHFKSKWDIQEHIIRKHKDTKDIQWFQCHLCEKKFKLKSLMAKHMKIHLTHEQIEDRLKICRVCGKGFKSRSAVRRHMICVHNIEEWNKERKCQECEYTTTEERLLKHHIETTHQKHEKRFYCKKCTFVSGESSDFKLHELSHKTEIDNQDLKYCCDKCDYKTSIHDHFKEHKLIHLKPEETQYFCCYHCSYKTKRKDSLQRHISLHFKNKEVAFHCYICEFVTLNRELIIRHFKEHSEHHSECDEEKYKYQLETHTKTSELRYSCDYCNYQTSTLRYFKRHILKQHLKPEDFYCYHCSFKSRHKGSLKEHIFRHFKSESVLFHCYICNFMTLKRDLLIEHLSEHKCDETRIRKFEKTVRQSDSPI